MVVCWLSKLWFLNSELTLHIGTWDTQLVDRALELRLSVPCYPLCPLSPVPVVDSTPWVPLRLWVWTPTPQIAEVLESWFLTSFMFLQGKLTFNPFFMNEFPSTHWIETTLHIEYYMRAEGVAQWYILRTVVEHLSSQFLRRLWAVQSAQ